jgi:hypothetical protein
MPGLNRHLQRGAASLAVVLLLLFATALGVLHLNRGLLFDQRISANQMRSTQALETAEAGIEWATGMLNSAYDVDSSCEASNSATATFRRRYVMTSWNATPPSSDVVPSTHVFPGCRLTADGPSCSCPNAPMAGQADVVASLGSAAEPSFTVSFAAVAGDPEAVQVTSRGCVASEKVCSPTDAASTDGNAVVTTIIKIRPLMRAVPAAPLTCGKSCTIGGSYNLVNANVETNGVLVNAGEGITTGNGTNLTTLPGMPSQNALIGNDASLSSLSSNDPTCENSAMFNAYFGSTIEKYRGASTTKQISCTSASDCKNQITNAYNDGWRAFYFDTDVHLSGNGTLGSSADPVTLVTASGLDINGTWDIYGLVFSNSADFNDLGTGSASIHGAQISCAAYKNNGNGTTAYDADALRNARRYTGVMVRVPGSWRDF